MLRGLLILIALLLNAPAFAVQDFTVTREELAVMPLYCTAHYGNLVGLSGAITSPLQHTIPQGCPASHHYCDGLKSRIRFDKHNKESGYWLAQGIQSFESVVQGDHWKSCPLQAEAYVNLGRAYLSQSKQQNTPLFKAEASFMKALEVQPDYLAAYYALGDYYVRLGDKKKALNLVEEGLRYAPNSVGLLRRFKELGGTTPPVPHHVTAKPMEQQDSPVKPPPVESVVIPAPPSKAGESVQAPEPQIGTPSNPWCRFCPP
jgi:tetratricopeptide (TPR) repeat protein